MWGTTILTKTPNRHGDPSKSLDIITGKPTTGNSRASLLLLNNYYRSLEIQYYIDKYKIDLSEYKDIKISNIGLLEVIRGIFDKRFLEASDKVCVYCNRQCSTIDGKNHRQDSATVDHKNPLVDIPDWFDEENLAVSCNYCNNKKGQLLYSEWMVIVEGERYKIKKMEIARSFLANITDKLFAKVNEVDTTERLSKIIEFANQLRDPIEAALLSDMAMHDAKGAKTDYKNLSKIIVQANYKAQLMLNPDIKMDSVDKQLSDYLNQSKKWQKIAQKRS